jgi:hypothetical protein
MLSKESAVQECDATEAQLESGRRVKNIINNKANADG